MPPLDFLSLLHTNGLILDANLLIVYLTGLYNPDAVGHTSATASYSRQDFEVLLNMIRVSKNVFVTPQILAEVSNFLEKSSSDNDNYHYSFIIFVKICLEQFYEVRKLIINEQYCFGLLKFGVADMSLLELSKREKCVVLTADGPLYPYLLSQGVRVWFWKNIQTCYHL